MLNVVAVMDSDAILDCLSMVPGLKKPSGSADTDLCKMVLKSLKISLAIGPN